MHPAIISLLGTCWSAIAGFTRVTAAMLVIKNKSVSLLWEHFQENSSKKMFIVLTINVAALSRDCKPRLGQFLFLSPVTVPEVFARINSSQFPSRF